MEKISSLNQRKDDLQKEIKELASLVGNKTRLKLELPELEVKKNAYLKDFADYEKRKEDIKVYEALLSKIKNEISQKKSDLEALLAKHSENLTRCQKESQEKQFLLNELGGKIAEITKIKQDLEVKLEQRRKDGEKERRDMEKEYNTRFQEMKISVSKLENDFKEYESVRRDALEEREGECSKWEERLNYKQEQLRQLKADLEKFYNRSFKHINF